MRRRLVQVAVKRGVVVGASFTSVGLPPRDEIVLLLIDADNATPSFAFVCHVPGLGWIGLGGSRPIPEPVFG